MPTLHRAPMRSLADLPARRVVPAVLLAWALLGCSGSDTSDGQSPGGQGPSSGPSITLYPTKLTLFDHHRARVFAKVQGAADDVTWSWDQQIPGVTLDSAGAASVVTMGNLSGRSELRVALSADPEVSDSIYVFNSANTGCCIRLFPQSDDEVDRARVRPGGRLSLSTVNALVRLGDTKREPTLGRPMLEIVDGPPGAELTPEGTFTAPPTEGIVRIHADTGSANALLEVVVDAAAPESFAVAPSYARLAHGATLTFATDPPRDDVSWEITDGLGGLFTGASYQAPASGEGRALVRAYTSDGIQAVGLVEYP